MKVAVIGAGAVGLCSAWFLKRAGHEVVVIDKGPVDGDKCSMGNSGIVVPSHFVPLAAPGMVATGLKMLAKKDSPFRIKPSLDPELAKWCLHFMKHCSQEHVDHASPVLLDMNLRSKSLFQAFDAQWPGQFGYSEKGLVVLCTSETELKEELHAAKIATELGLRVETLESRSAVDTRTGILSTAIGGVHYLDDAHMKPGDFVRLLHSRLSSEGVQFWWSTEVTGFGTAVRSVKTDREEILADVVVIAAGTWSGKLARILDLELPLQPGKGMNFETPQLLDVKVPFIAKEARIAVTPMGDAVRFGGTMELGEWAMKPDKKRSEGLASSIVATFPGVDGALFTPAWSGLRPCSPDGLPYIGSFPQAENVIFATGHAMMGLSLAPVTGEMVSRIVDGKDRTDPRLAPGRFS